MHRLSLSGLLAFSLVVGLTACNTGTQQQMTTPAAGETTEPSDGDATADPAASGQTPAAADPSAAGGTAAAPIAPAVAGATLQKV
jgi:hypothetical protein